MPDLKNRIVTPYTDPDRWTNEEKALFDQGLCSYPAGSGDPSYAPHCKEPSRPGASFGNCVAHERELLEDFYPDGSPRR